MADEYLTTARKRIREGGVFDRTEEIQKAQARYEEIIRQALHPVVAEKVIKEMVVGADGKLRPSEKVVKIPGRKNFTAAIEAQRSLCRLYGLDAPTRHEIIGSTDNERVVAFLSEAIAEGINQDALMAVTLEKMGIQMPDAPAEPVVVETEE